MILRSVSSPSPTFRQTASAIASVELWVDGYLGYGGSLREFYPKAAALTDLGF
jgi:hypothetical protein